jgi:hypothetical protein
MSSRLKGSVSLHGIPVVHLESHETNPWQVDANELCFGAGDGPGVSWQQFGEWLAPLNAEYGGKVRNDSTAIKAWPRDARGWYSGFRSIRHASRNRLA